MERGDKLANKIGESEEETNLQYKKDLHIHVFGPYAGICSGVLEELTRQLRKDGFEKTKTCAELDDPHRPPDTDNDEWNWIRSEDCLEKADVAIFVFFETNNEVTVRPDEKPAELNSSMIWELKHWIDVIGKGEQETLVIFEGESRDSNLGSLISGGAKANDIVTRDVECQDYIEIFDIMRGKCWDWVDSFVKNS